MTYTAFTVPDGKAVYRLESLDIIAWVGSVVEGEADPMAELIKEVTSASAAICITLAISALSFICSQLWIAHSNHKQDRRNYEYKRSKEVNKKRFYDELDAVEVLAEAFMRLRLKMHQLQCCSDGDYDKVNQEWRDLYEDTAIILGRSAPVLNLRTLSDGAPTCGVDSKHMGEDEIAKGVVASDSAPSGISEEGALRRCTLSLYLRSVKFLDKCLELGREVCRLREKGMNVVDEPMILFAPEEERYRFRFDEYVASDCYDDESVDARLGIYYKQFINCAFCRIRNSDTGQRDARRINRQNARRARLSKRIPWSRGGGYDRKCPHRTPLN